VKSYFVQTRHGPIVFAANQQTMDSRAPLVLLVHGAFRAPDDLVPLAAGLSEVAFASLPGHRGAPELEKATLSSWTEAFDEAISVAFPRPVLAVGESLGGLIVMGLTSPRSRLIIDPFLRTEHLWPLTEPIARAKAERRHVGATQVLEGEIKIEGGLQNRSHMRVLAGNHELGERRLVYPIPSLLDAHDEAILRKLFQVDRVPGGHCLVVDNLNACRAAVRTVFKQMATNSIS
jgi:hypothetical protein